MASATDPCSFSSFSKCVTKHLNLTYHVDFDSHVIKAKVALTVEVLVDNFTSLVQYSSHFSIWLASKLLNELAKFIHSC